MTIRVLSVGIMADTGAVMAAKDFNIVHDVQIFGDFCLVSAADSVTAIMSLLLDGDHLVTTWSHQPWLTL